MGVQPGSARRKRVLMLSSRYPTPPLRGDQTRVYFLAKALAEFADVTVVAFGAAGVVEAEGFRVRGVAPGIRTRLLANGLAPNLALPAQVRLFLDRSMQAVVKRELGTSPDVVHISLARMGPYMPVPTPGGPHRHVDLMDAISSNLATRADEESVGLARALRAESALLLPYERALAERADSSSVVSAVDRDALGLQHCAIVPNGVDLGLFPFYKSTDREPELIFFGNLGYFHNIRAAQLIAKEVLPQVRAEHPTATLRLVGARPSRAVEDLARERGVTVTGEVPAIACELRRASVAVLPLLSGSGIKNKVLEAFASGVPVVSNGLGLQGIDGARDGVHFLQAESPADLALATSRLLGDDHLRSTLARNALGLVKTSYSWRDQALKLLDIYGLSTT